MQKAPDRRMVAMASSHKRMEKNESVITWRRLETFFVHLSVFWMTICFSLYAVVGRDTQQGQPPLRNLFVFILLRQGLGALVLLALARLNEGPFPSCFQQHPRMIWRILFCGFIGIGLSQNFFLLGERFTSATNAVTFEPLVPIVTGVVSFALGTESLTAAKILGSFIGVCGAIVTAQGSASRNNGAVQSSLGNHFGNIFCIGQVLCIAIYLVALKNLPHKKTYPVWITFCLVCAGAILTVVVSFSAYLIAPPAYWNPENKTFQFTNMKFLCEVGFAVVFATVQNYLIRTRAATILSASKVGMYLTLNPPITALAAHILLNEEITLSEIGGAATVALGLLIYLACGESQFNLHGGGAASGIILRAQTKDKRARQQEYRRHGCMNKHIDSRNDEDIDDALAPLLLNGA